MGASVGRDEKLFIYDIRQGNKPAGYINALHQGGVTCLSWHQHDDHLILTGGEDGIVHMIDTRKIKITKSFKKHSSPISSLQWRPGKSDSGGRYFSSSSQDGAVLLWNSKAKEENDKLLFRHCLHPDCVSSVEWNNKSADRWHLATVSNPHKWHERFGGKGGILQIWKMNWLLTKKKDDALA